MAEQPALGFAGLLRQLRARARLTQGELAEAAGLSPRSVSDLERGINRTARKDTAVRLAGALGLAEPARSLFVAAACGRIGAGQVLAARSRQAGSAGGAGFWAAQRPGTGAGYPGRPGPHQRPDRRAAVYQRPHRRLAPGPDPGQDRLPPAAPT
jgi:transcriptional regulator with XRE-family HTH domain